MRTNITKLALLAVLGVGAAAAYAESNIDWPPRATTAIGQPTANQLALYGYASNGAPARVVNVASGTKYVNVTRLETVKLNVGGQSITWNFDTLNTTPFPLSRILPGTDGVTVYVAQSPSYIR